MFKSDKSIGLLGVPFEKGQSLSGVSCGPKLIRSKRIIQQIEDYDLEFHDFGNIDTNIIGNDNNIFNAKYPRMFLHNTMTIADKIEEIIDKNYIPLTIGGDHSITTGTILGHSRKHEDLCVIWVDAHADINTPLSSTSGNIHGMPLSFLIHEMQNEMPWIEEFKDIPPVLSSKNIVYIGLRSVDPYERHVLNKYNIKSFSMEDVDRDGIKYVIQQAIKSVNPNLDKYFHLSFDIDALDPLYAPSTGTAVPGGLTLREGVYLCEQLCNTGKLAAIDVTEINTQLGTYSEVVTTINSVTKIIQGCLGIRREGIPLINSDYYDWQTLNPTRQEMFSTLEKENENL